MRVVNNSGVDEGSPCPEEYCEPQDKLVLRFVSPRRLLEGFVIRVLLRYRVKFLNMLHTLFCWYVQCFERLKLFWSQMMLLIQGLQTPVIRGGCREISPSPEGPRVPRPSTGGVEVEVISHLARVLSLSDPHAVLGLSGHLKQSRLATHISKTGPYMSEPYVSQTLQKLSIFACGTQTGTCP